MFGLDLFEIALIGIAAFAAGAVNSVAGGGTFFSFPALLAVGVPPVVANASNSVSLWPGSLAGAWAFRRELKRFSRSLPILSVVAFIGGIAGGLLLLATSNAAFAIQGFKDVHEINALKNWLSAVIYSVAVGTFVIADAVSWPHTLIMLVTATIGGYWGAAVARKLPAIWLRRFIIAVGGLLTLYYFGKTL